jgi:hypothetical protein
MEINDFFNKIDQTTESKAIEEKAKEARERVFTEMTLKFADKLSGLVKNYIPEFEKRGFKCQEKTGNLPYWSFEVQSPQGKTVKVAIVNSHQNQYEIAFYCQEERIHAPIHIRDSFDTHSIDVELQKLFEKLV